MTAIKLQTLSVEKPWGRHHLGFGFGDVPADRTPVGEVWFAAPGVEEHELMVKYLFTSEKLSIQVHPNDQQAKAAGFARGKEECWIILDALPESTIAMGTINPLTSEELRRAALDGTIEQLVDWKPVVAGDVIYLPAGTIHAIGAGITLIEVQQNVDLTYRLYDYGRPRELHLEKGVPVSRGAPFTVQPRAHTARNGREISVDGEKFVVERWSWTGARTVALPENGEGWFVPVSGTGSIDGKTWSAGECWHITNEVTVTLDDGSLIIFAYPGSTPLILAD
jgi:mannose-6-phosphate isomerase